MNALYWREPAWALLALLPIAWLLLGRWRTARLRARYADPALWPWALGSAPQPGAVWRRIALAAASLLLGLAAAGPRLPADAAAAAAPGRATLMVVLDLSRSMDAADVWPSRRRLALRALHGLLPQLAASRVGLVVVAGRAHLLWPASPDRAALGDLLSRLDALRPPSHGTALADGIGLAVAAAARDSGPRQLLVLSDGDLGSAARLGLAMPLARAANRGVGVLFAGVGSAGGAALPGPDGDWLRRGGEPVTSRLDAVALQRLVAAAGGRYLTLPVEDAAGALRAALPGTLTRLPLAADAPIAWRELFPWLLCPALLLWALALLRLPPLAAPAGLGATAVYLVGLTLALPVRADNLAEAHAALAAGDPARAQALFDALPGFAARMGSGSACHRRQDWGCARQAFAQAVLLAPDDDTRATAIYNLAHSDFQTGAFRGAARLFDDTLRYRADYPAARHNRDFARALADEVDRLADREQAERRPRRGAASRATAGIAPPAEAALTLAPDEPAATVAGGAQQRQALINRGLAHTRLAEAGRADAALPWGQGYGAAADTAADITLWQTLLERAEGLPAAPTQPLDLPGVRPW